MRPRSSLVGSALRSQDANITRHHYTAFEPYTYLSLIALAWSMATSVLMFLVLELKRQPSASYLLSEGPDRAKDAAAVTMEWKV